MSQKSICAKICQLNLDRGVDLVILSILHNIYYLFLVASPPQ